jgi:thioredoxin 1
MSFFKILKDLLPHEKVYPVELSNETFYPSLKNSPVPVIVDFYVEKSQPCAMVYSTLTKFATDFKGRARVGAFNLAQDTDGKIIVPCKIKAVPTVGIFIKDEPVEMIEGVAGYLKIQELFEKAEQKMAKTAKK